MILLTREQVIQHMPTIKLKHGYIMDTNVNQYWKNPLGTGTTPDIGLAIRDTIYHLYNTVLSWGGNNAIRYELVDQELAEKLTKYKCNAHSVLGPALIKMLESAPANPVLRAQVMAIVGRMPAPELDTYDKIREWVETTHDPSTQASVPVSTETTRLIFSVRATASRMVSGRCNFSGRELSNHTSNLQHKIDEYINTDGNLSVRTLAEIVRNEAIAEMRQIPTDDLEMQIDDDDYQYEDYVTSSEGIIGIEVRQGIDATIINLRNHIRSYYPREVQSRFGL